MIGQTIWFPTTVESGFLDTIELTRKGNKGHGSLAEPNFVEAANTPSLGYLFCLIFRRFTWIKRIGRNRRWREASRRTAEGEIKYASPIPEARGEQLTGCRAAGAEVDRALKADKWCAQIEALKAQVAELQSSSSMWQDQKMLPLSPLTISSPTDCFWGIQSRYS